MSTRVANKALTVPSRGADAVARAVEALGVADTKLLTVVLIEAATEELLRNARFADRVRLTYDAEAAVKVKPPVRKKASLPQLVPQKHIEGHQIDLGAAPNPYFLLELYGKEQLRLALSRYPASALKESVEVVQEHHVGLKPKGKTKTILIDYIVGHVAGPGY